MRAQWLREKEIIDQIRALMQAAFQQNPEFYAFYRSLEAYRQSFHAKSDVMVLEPTSDFFKFFKNPGGKGR